MSNIRWKPMPDHPGYEINRSGWVRNERGYVVASGRGATLFVGGARVGVARKRLLEIAAVLFGEGAPSLQAEASSAKPEDSPVCEGAELPSRREEPVDTVMATDVRLHEEPAPEPAAVLLQAPAPDPDASEPLSVEERVRCWNNPERVLPLRDPWANGSIETDSKWDWAGVQ